MKPNGLVVIAIAALLLTACENKNASTARTVEAEPAPTLEPMDSTSSSRVPLSDYSSTTTGSGSSGYSSGSDYQTSPAYTSTTTTPPASTSGGSSSSGSTPTASYNWNQENLAPSDNAAPGGRTHTVERGDTLYSLARKYYNDQSKWRLIYEANSARVRNPNRLDVGIKLIIP